MKSVKIRNVFFLFKSPSKNGWSATIILMVCLVLTFAAAFFTAREDAVTEQNEFSLVCNDLKNKISSRLHAHAQLLRAGSAFFAASDTITRKNWKAFCEFTKIDKNLPGVQGIGFSMIIQRKQLKQHIERIRREGFTDYTVKPPGERAVYSSIIYLEPFSGRNLRAFGYDMFSEPTRRKAMEISRDSDVAMLSGKVILVQETSEDVQTGSLMYVPVYRNDRPANTVEQRRAAIRGWIYSPYRMNDLMRGVLGRWDLIHHDRIHLQVYDNTMSAGSILYDSQGKDTLPHTDLPSPRVLLPVDFNGKRWILLFTGSEKQSGMNVKVLIILIGGILVSLLLAALYLSLRNTQGRAQHIAGHLTSELQKSEERFKMLLNSTAEGIYGIGLEGQCTFSNTACHQILGYDNAGMLLGKNMHSLIHHSRDDGSSIDEKNCLIYKSFRRGERVHVDFEVFWRADGTCFPVEYWSDPVFSKGKIAGSVITFFDITERRQSEEKIREARYEAERANLAKSKFLSRMSHELRTPLNSILGFAQLMEMSEISQSNRKWVGHILNSGRHLLNLINEVLDIAGIESGRVKLSAEPVQLNRAIMNVLEMAHPLAIRGNQTIELLDSPASRLFVKADHLRLQQVLLNLISNAVKYNREGGTVIVRAELREPDLPGLAMVRVSISDTGAGIEQEDIGKLFLPFERIGAEKTDAEGTGLGLALVKELMIAMGGFTGVESVPGKGSTFWIELPQTDGDETIPKYQDHDRFDV